jgi:hypothetical protein
MTRKDLIEKMARRMCCGSKDCDCTGLAAMPTAERERQYVRLIYELSDALLKIERPL